MKKVLVLFLALVMILSALPVAVAYADEAPGIVYSEHLDYNSDKGYDYNVTNASIAWVKQAKGALIWVPADDARSDAEIIAQAIAADPSLNNAVDDFAVLKGLGTAETPNTNGSKAVITVSVIDGETVFSIDGKYSHFVMDATVVPTEPADSEEPTEPEVPEEEPTEPEVPEEEPTDEPTEALAETGAIRIDAPLKMAVAFEDGTVYYGGEMKEVVFGQEYAFQMCSVNWDNGVFDGVENGIRGTVVYRMIVLHRDEFLARARAAKENPERYTVKGIDIIDNEAKTIIVNGDASDTHLETDVNNFFMAYRFHFEHEGYAKKTGIANVINTPVESLSVNLPLGSTIACNAYDGDEMIDSANVFITNNSGEGVYDDVYLTSVNDYTWAH